MAIMVWASLSLIERQERSEPSVKRYRFFLLYTMALQIYPNSSILKIIQTRTIAPVVFLAAYTRAVVRFCPGA